MGDSKGEYGVRGTDRVLIYSHANSQDCGGVRIEAEQVKDAYGSGD